MRTRLPLGLVAVAALVAQTGCGAQPEPSAPTAAAPTPVSATALGPDTGESEPAPQDTAVLVPADVPDPLPNGFVRLREVAPGVAQEIRYTTAYNFVGTPIDGYLAPECILTEPAARALADVARRLRADGLGLKVYDCYRPQTAVSHFARWTGVPDESMKRAFYPDEPKGRLFSRGYIATRSGHSRGSTVDLTLVALPARDAVLTRFPDPADGPLPRCDAPVGERLDERDLDMGTAYDCLSPSAATDSRAVPAQAQRNRERLRAAMSEGGFRNYSKEWWHFTLRGEPHRGTYFDFPVE